MPNRRQRRINKVVKEVSNRIVAARLDQILVSTAKENLEQSRNAETGGRLEPLKTVRGEYRTPRGRRGVKVNWRVGGTPLRDTDVHIYNRLSGVTRRRRGGKSIDLILRIPAIGMMHIEGFQTQGPNFIPLTRKAQRRHQKGVNPAIEGLFEGKDYVMAWKGVRVSGRPFFSLDDDTMLDRLQDAIMDAITNP